MSATVQALRQATGQAVKALHLEHFKRVTVKFDPFHSNATPIRDFLYYVSSTQVRQTNPECALKAEVVCDRSEPTVELLHCEWSSFVLCRKKSGCMEKEASHSDWPWFGRH
ncbi:mitochondrial ribosomal protein L53 isoform X2 [Haemaphysalis longicornis]